MSKCLSLGGSAEKLSRWDHQNQSKRSIPVVSARLISLNSPRPLADRGRVSHELPVAGAAHVADDDCLSALASVAFR